MINLENDQFEMWNSSILNIDELSKFYNSKNTKKMLLFGKLILYNLKKY